MRGDLIEAFKIIRGFVDYGQNLFKFQAFNFRFLVRESLSIGIFCLYIIYKTFKNYTGQETVFTYRK